MKVNLFDFEVEITATKRGQENTTSFLNDLALVIYDAEMYNKMMNYNIAADECSKAFNELYCILFPDKAEAMKIAKEALS